MDRFYCFFTLFFMVGLTAFENKTDTAVALYNSFGKTGNVQERSEALNLAKKVYNFANCGLRINNSLGSVPPIDFLKSGIIYGILMKESSSDTSEKILTTLNNYDFTAEFFEREDYLALILRMRLELMDIKDEKKEFASAERLLRKNLTNISNFTGEFSDKTRSFALETRLHLAFLLLQQERLEHDQTAFKSALSLYQQVDRAMRRYRPKNVPLFSNLDTPLEALKMRLFSVLGITNNSLEENFLTPPDNFRPRSLIHRNKIVS